MNEASAPLIPIILVAFHFFLFHSYCAAAAPPPPPSTPVNCSNELVKFSSCLPYIAAFPDNISETPPPQCCNHVSLAFHSGSVICLCYFVRRPGILGFPLNSTRLISLTSVCHLKHRKSKANFCLKSLCSGSAALPPLNSIADPDHSKPNNSAVAALPTQQRSPHESNNTLVTPAASTAKDESDNSPVRPAAEPAKDASDDTQVAPEAEPAEDLPIQQSYPTTTASISSATIRTQGRTSPVIIAFSAWFKFYNFM